MMLTGKKPIPSLNAFLQAGALVRLNGPQSVPWQLSKLLDHPLEWRLDESLLNQVGMLR